MSTTFYIYEVPDYIWPEGDIGKIGCTKEPNVRFRKYKDLTINILEEHADGWIAGNREIELQKEYNYRVDHIHYMVASNIVNARDQASYDNASKEGYRTEEFRQHARENYFKYAYKPFTEAGSKSGKSRRNITFEQAQEIRSKWKFRVYTSKMLAKEYGITNAAVKAILQNRSYKQP